MTRTATGDEGASASSPSFLYGVPRHFALVAAAALVTQVLFRLHLSPLSPGLEQFLLKMAPVTYVLHGAGWVAVEIVLAVKFREKYGLLREFLAFTAGAVAPMVPVALFAVLIGDWGAFDNIAALWMLTTGVPVVKSYGVVWAALFMGKLIYRWSQSPPPGAEKVKKF